MGDFVAQQAGRYELEGWLSAADPALRQHANLNESRTRAAAHKVRANDLPAVVDLQTGNGAIVGLETRHGARTVRFFHY